MIEGIPAYFVRGSAWDSAWYSAYFVRGSF